MAIAADSAASLGRDYGILAWTVAFTNTAGDSVWLALFSDTDAPGATVTYGGSAMSLVESVGSYMALFVLMNPPTGVNNFVITRTGLMDLIAAATSYSGCFTAGSGLDLIEDVGKAGPNNAAPTLDASATSTTDNCWGIGCMYDGQYLIAGANTLVRAQNTTSGQRWDSIDTNGPKTPAGTITMQADDQAAYDNKAIICCAVKPAGGGGGGTWPGYIATQGWT